MDDPGSVDHVGGSREPAEELGDTGRPAHVADDDGAARRGRQRVAFVVGGDEGARATGAGVRAGAEQVVEEGPAEPPGGAGDDRDVGWVDGGHQWARLVVSTKCRALRIANAITDPCGLTP